MYIRRLEDIWTPFESLIYFNLRHVSRQYRNLIYFLSFNSFMTEADICSANQWTSFYMIMAPVMKEVKCSRSFQNQIILVVGI